MDILVKALIGGAMIALLLVLARLGQYVTAGLLVSAPALSLYVWWWVGREHGPQALRVSLKAAMWSAIPWVVYLGVVYLLAGRLPLWSALAAGVLAWLAVAFVFALLLRAVG